MDSISDFYFRINKNFMKASVFYVPKFLIDDLSAINTEADFSVLNKYVNRLLVVDNNGEVGELLKSPSQIVGKELYLEENLMFLLQKRDEYLPLTFDYIFERYCKHLVVYIGLAKWLKSNLRDYIKPNEETTKAFELQLDLILKHECEVGQYFEAELQRLDTELVDQLNHVKEPKKYHIKDVAQVQNIVLNNQVIKPNINKDKKSKLKDLKEFTHSYAEQLILEKVFHVKS
ncbi:MAG: hypothetical protein Wins2KO_13110 [Winogradskyella sp.]